MGIRLGSVIVLAGLLFSIMLAFATTAAGAPAGDNSVDGVDTATLAIVVPDDTPPVLSLPDDLTVEALFPGGAPVEFEATATDEDPPNPAVSCTPPSGSIFPLGTTTVECSATDVAGNVATGSFQVTVQDTTPPTLNLSSDITVDAFVPEGALLAFAISVLDNVGVASVICVPNISGGVVFPIGTTTVTCTAIDTSGNSTSKTLTVTVRGAAEQLDDLRATVDGLDLSPQLKHPLQIKLWLADLLLDNGVTQVACHFLSAFVDRVEALSGGDIDPIQANQLIRAAEQIRAVLGC